jgi:hypothetical protein
MCCGPRDHELNQWGASIKVTWFSPFTSQLVRVKLSLSSVYERQVTNKLSRLLLYQTWKDWTDYYSEMWQYAERNMKFSGKQFKTIFLNRYNVSSTDFVRKSKAVAIFSMFKLNAFKRDSINYCTLTSFFNFSNWPLIDRFWLPLDAGSTDNSTFYFRYPPFNLGRRQNSEELLKCLKFSLHWSHEFSST